MSRLTPTSSTVQPTSTTEVETPAVPPAETENQTTPTQPTRSTASGSSPEQPAHVVLGLNDGDRRVVAVLIVVALLLMLVHWYRLTQYRPQPIEVLHPDGYVFQLDVNNATWIEWMQLERIGETLARRIVEDRRLNGPFTSVDDVQRVPGIGPKTLQSLRPHLRCDAAPARPANRNDAAERVTQSGRRVD